MAVQVSYPGVYIEEFAPGAPIQGVGTSTAAFIGTATKGPLDKPTLIQSWDAFVATFGGLIAEAPTSYLAPAVYGFFLNGGTICYVVRVGTAAMASAPLDSRGSADPALLALARQEGPAGNSISVQVSDSSRLANMLADAGVAATTLKAHQAQTHSIATNAMSADRRELKVVSNSGFAPGDRVLLSKPPDSATAVVKATKGTDTLVLTAPVGGNVDFSGSLVRTADLAAGQKSFRLDVPAGISLNQALPRGTAVKITLGGASEIRTVESSGGDTLTLSDPLTGTYSMADPATLPTVASLEFDLLISDAVAGVSETFALLAMNPQHPGYWSNNVASELVTIEDPPAPPAPTPADLRPAVGSYNLGGGTADDRAAAWISLTNDPNSRLDLLKAYDEVSLVCIPGATDKFVQQMTIAHCEAMQDRFAILDSLLGAMPGNGIRTQFADVRSEKGYAALYYPWILARNPLTGKDELWPPSGHIAGVYARTDAQRGVHKAPANANLRGALGLERRLTNEEQGPLNLMGINVLRVFPEQAQPMVWGARTTATDRNWQYINVRRLFLFLEESIQEGINWAIFEPNNLALWQKLKRTINEFLTRVWRDGALFGETADKAFYVRIDEVLNPPSTQALGRLYIEIGVRPTYPAEFIIVRIGIWQGGSEVSES
jgi:phage tail sheath protein FI